LGYCDVAGNNNNRKVFIHWTEQFQHWKIQRQILKQVSGNVSWFLLIFVADFSATIVNFSRSYHVSIILSL